MRRVLFAGFLTLSFAAAALSQSVLHFPRVVSRSDLYTGLAVSNASQTSAVVTFSAYGPDGILLSGANVQNPVTVTVPAGGQYARLFSEIFSMSGTFNGWVRATSATPGLTGFYLNGNNAITDLAGAAAATPAPEFILPFISENATTRTEISVINPNDEGAAVTMTLHTSDGQTIGTASVDLGGRALYRQTAGTAFPGIDLASASHIRVRSQRFVIASELVADFRPPGGVGHESAALNGVAPRNSQRYILPQFVTGGGWMSWLGVVNGGGVPQEVTITAFGDDGKPLAIGGNPRKVTLQGNAAFQAALDTVFTMPDASLRTGWIELSGPVGFLAGFIGYGNTTSPAFATVPAVPVESASPFHVYSQVAEAAGFFTGLTIVNPGTADASVEVFVLRPDGTTVGRSTLTLGPGQRVGRLFRELLPATLEQVGGWLFLRSSAPIIGTTLFGGTTGLSLANVPQQSPAGDFQPPVQQTSAITGVVTQDGWGIGSITVTLSGPVQAIRTTDESGRFIFGQLPPGDYRVAVARPGATFAPTERQVRINADNVDRVDFQAAGILPSGVPTIQFVSPASAFVSNSSIAITILGSNFTPGSLVHAGASALAQTALATTFVSDTELRAALPAALLSRAGALTVSVITAPPGGGQSNNLDFTVSTPPANPLIVTRVGVGGFPAGVAIHPGRKIALVANEAADSVSVIDLRTLAVTGEIRVGRSPAEIAIHADRDLALVTNTGGNTVSVIDLRNNTVTRTINVGDFPLGIAVNPRTNRAVSVNGEGGSVAVIDLDSLTVIATIPVGQRPSNVAINPQTNQAVVTNRASNSISIVDLAAGNVVATVPVGSFPRGVAIHAESNRAIIANPGSDNVSIVNLNTRQVVTTVTVGASPTGVALHPLTNNAVISNSGVRQSGQITGDSTVSIVNLDQAAIVATIQVGSAPFGVAVDAEDQRAVVANFGNNDVIIIRIPNPVPRITSILPRTFPASGGPVTLTINGTGFVPTSVVTLNGRPLATTFVSNTQLRAVLSADMAQQLLLGRSGAEIADAAKGPDVFRQVTPLTLTISVENPGPGGGNSPPPPNPGDGQIIPENLVPVLTSVSPREVRAGTQGFVLTLNGNNFNSTSIINFGSNLHSPTTVTPTQMTVAIPANELVGGLIQVSVTNPSPGGGTSQTQPVGVSAQSNPAPTVTSVSPASLTVGAGAVITVTGSGFVAGTSATLGAVAGVVSNLSTILFTLSPADTQTAGSLSGFISVPAPGGGSVSFTVNVLAGAPTASGVSPTSVNAGSPGVDVTVTGTGFTPGALIAVGGTPVPTTVSGSTSATGAVPAGIIATPGQLPVTITNPAPGGGTASAGTLSVNSPAPVLTTINPSSAVAGAQGLTLQIGGSNFFSASQVLVSATPVPTTFISSTSLSADIPAALIDRGGIYSVAVSNPPPGGGNSNALSLTITNPAPVLSSINPTSAPATQNITLTVSGSSFVPNSVISFAGQTLATTFVSATQLTATIQAPVPFGNQPVVVINPAPGGGTSASQTLQITSPVPSIGGVSPTTVQPGQSVTITGTGFGPGTVVLINGSPVAASVNSATQISFIVPTPAPSSTMDITVQNPPPGGGTSAPFTITVANPVPSIGSVTPNTGVSGTFVTISVTGSSFVPGASIVFNGTTLSTTFVSSSSLSASLTLGAAGIATVTVSNPGPGGGASNVMTFQITPSTPQTGVPVLTSITPVSALQGSTVALTINGTNLTSGALAVSGTGIVVNGLRASSATQIIALVQVSGAAGARNLTVTTTGGVSNAMTFTVNANTLNATAFDVTTPFGAAGQVGAVDGVGTAARFNTPFYTWGDDAHLYVSDQLNHVIRRISLSTGQVTTIAGAAGQVGGVDGTGSAARFSAPGGLWGDGTFLYVADQGNQAIRRIDLTTFAVNTISGALGQAGNVDGGSSVARFSDPQGLWGDGANLYVSQLFSGTIRKVSIANGSVTTVAGTAGVTGQADGTGSAAQFNIPAGVWGDGAFLYIADQNNHAIRRMGLSTFVVDTLAGLKGTPGSTDGIGTAARFNQPGTLGGDGTYLFLAAQSGHNVRRIAIATGTTDTIAGLAGTTGTVDGTGTAARFNLPLGGWTDGTAVFIGDNRNATIRRVAPSTGPPVGVPTLTAINPTTGVQGQTLTLTLTGTNFVAGQTTVTFGTPGFANVHGVNVTSTTSAQVLVDLLGAGAAIVTVTTPGGTSLGQTFTSTVNPFSGAATADSSVFAGRVGAPGLLDAVGTAAQFNGPSGIWGDGTHVYVSDFLGGQLRRINLTTRAVTTPVPGVGQTLGLWGDGRFLYIAHYGANQIRKLDLSNNTISTLATGLSGPFGLWGDGTNLYVVESSQYVVSRVSLATGAVTVIAGSPGVSGSVDGTGSAARFSSPGSLWSDGTNLYVGERGVGVIRRINIATAVVTTIVGVAGSPGNVDGVGTAARMSDPYAAWGDGPFLYIADATNTNIRRVDLNTLQVTTIAGSSSGFADGTGSAIQFRAPTGVWGDGTALYVTEQANHIVRRLVPTPAVTAPTITSVTPNTGLQGANVFATIIGTNLTASTLVNLSGAGVVVTGVHFISPTRIDVMFQLSGSAGARTVSVTNAGGTSSTLPFTIGASQLLPTAVYDVQTPFGSAGNPGSTDAVGTAARFQSPGWLFHSGTSIFVSDTLNHVIRRIDPVTGAVTTIAGLAGASGGVDGTGSAARFNNPHGIWGDGRFLYIADNGSHTIRRLDPLTFVVTTIAGSTGQVGSLDGTGVAARFTTPTGIWGNGPSLFITESLNHTVRQLQLATGTVTTLAGLAGNLGAADGTGSSARFTGPAGIWGDSASMYVADFGNHTVRRITGANVTTVVGVAGAQGTVDGTGTAARLSNPSHMWGDGSFLYFTEQSQHVVRRMDLTTNAVVTIAGSSGVAGTADGIGTAARFQIPNQVIGNGAMLYVTDLGNHTIRTMTPVVVSAPTITTLTPNTAIQGQFLTATINGTNFLAGSTSVSVSGTGVVVTNVVVSSVTQLTAYLQVSGTPGARNLTVTTPGGTSAPATLTIGAAPLTTASLLNVTTTAGTPLIAANTDGVGSAARFFAPNHVWFDGTAAYVPDNIGEVIRRLDANTAAVTTLAGLGNASGDTDGIGSAARFFGPIGIWGDGINLYVSNRTRHTIRKIVIATGAVTTVAGSAGVAGSVDGIGTAARFNLPAGLWGDGVNLYIADSSNTIRVMNLATLNVTTLAGLAGVQASVDGTGSAARFGQPYGIWGDGQNLFVTELNGPIRRVVISTAVVTTPAGNTSGFTVDGVGTAASFLTPSSIWGDGSVLYITEAGHVVRKLDLLTATVSTVAGLASTVGQADGLGSAARFSTPAGIAGDGNRLIIADTSNSTLRTGVGVVSALPSITSLTPNSAIQGQFLTATINGTNFLAGTTSVNVSGTGVVVTNVVVQGPTQLIAFLQVSGAPGNRSVTVTNPSGTSPPATLSITANTLTPATALNVTTRAGLSGAQGLADGTGSAARFRNPLRIWFDGTFAYVADQAGPTIRRVDAASGVVTTIAGQALNPGTADGTGSAARFNLPTGIWGDGVNLYVTDDSSHTIRRIALATGAVTTIAGGVTLPGSTNGIGTAARFSSPDGLWGDGTTLYIADQGNHTIRAMNLATLNVTTFAGSTGVTGTANGVGTAAQFSSPRGIWGDGQSLYVVEFTGTVRRIDIATTTVTTLAGGPSAAPLDGVGTAARFQSPAGIWGDGSVLFVAENSQLIRKIDISTATVTTVAGLAGTAGSADGSGSAARFQTPRGISGDGVQLIIADILGHTIRSATGVVLALPSISALVPAVANQGQTLRVQVSGANFVAGQTTASVSGTGVVVNGVSVLSSTTAVLTLQVSGTPGLRSVTVATPAGSSGAFNFTINPNAISGAAAFTVQRIVGTGIQGSTDGVGTAALTFNPHGMWSDGTNLYFADQDNSTIRRLVLATGAVTTIAGSPGQGGTADGVGSAARFGQVRGLWSDGTSLFISDFSNHTIRRMDLATLAVTTFAGGAGVAGHLNGVGTLARFANPDGIWGDGAFLYVADSSSFTIRRIDLFTALVTTIAGSNGSSGSTDGTGSAARFGFPTGMWGNGTDVFIVDFSGQTIRRMNLSTLAVTTIAGTSFTAGSADGVGSAARFFNPISLWGDGSDLFVSDASNHTVRRINVVTASVTTVAGLAGAAGLVDGVGSTARFSNPKSAFLDGSTIWVTDGTNNAIRQLTPAALPSITSLTPNAATRGASIPVVISGGNFVAGATTVTAGAGVVVSSVNVTSPSSLTAFLQVSGAPGARTLTVTTGAGSVNANFTINANNLQLSNALDLLTAAGTASVSGSTDGVLGAAQFNSPDSAWSDGTSVYISDRLNHTIRRMVIATGAVTTVAGNPGVAGSTNGVGTAARFFRPTGVWGNGRHLYIAELGNPRIRRMDLATLDVVTVAGSGAIGYADGVGTAAVFDQLNSIWGDSTHLYIPDRNNNVIRRMDFASSTVTTWLGVAASPGSVDGVGTAARLTSPIGVWGDGTTLYFVEQNAVVRQAVIATAAVTTIAGQAGASGYLDSIGTVARFNDPTALWGDGAVLYLTERANHTIRKIDVSSAAVTTVAGTPGTAGFILGTGGFAQMNEPFGIVGDGLNFLITEQSGHVVRLGTATVIGVPVITSMTPNSGLLGATTRVTITGSNFTPGTTLSTCCVVNGVEVLSPTQLVATVQLSTFTVGVTSFVVTNPFGASAPAGFAINASLIAPVTAGNVFTTAGLGTVSGTADGTGTAARFTNPVAVWSDGTNLYIADGQNHTIRRMVLSTGAVTTLAGTPGVTGSTNGIGSAARFNHPNGLWGNGRYLFITDDNNHTIRRLDLNTNTVTTFAGLAANSGSADGTGTLARFQNPGAITGDGIFLYVADSANHTIRRIAINTAAVTTIAGSPGVPGTASGVGTTARFNLPSGLWTDGVTLYITDYNNNAVRAMDIFTRNVALFAGIPGAAAGTADGVGSSAQFNHPRGIWSDANHVFIAEQGNYTARKINVLTQAVTTIAGLAPVNGYVDAPGSSARFEALGGLWGDGAQLWITDEGNHAIRSVAPAAVPVLIGLSTASGTQGDTLRLTLTGANFIAGSTVNFSGSGVVVSRVNVLSPNTAEAFVVLAGAPGVRTVTITNIAGTSGTQNFTINSNQYSAAGALEVLTAAGNAFTTGTADGVGTAARFNQPSGAWGDGTTLYIADSSNHTIRAMTLATRNVTTFAGSAGNAGFVDAVGTAARFNAPEGLWGDGTFLYVADAGNHRIRRIDLVSRTVTTFAGTGIAGGSDGPATTATFSLPVGLWGDGTNLYISSGHAIRRVNIALRTVTTFAGNAATSGTANGVGSVARFNAPAGLWGDGTNLYIADEGNFVVRQAVLATALVTTLAGTMGSFGDLDGLPGVGQMGRPVALWGDGTVLFVSQDELVRRIVVASGLLEAMAGAIIDFGYIDGIGDGAEVGIPGGIWGMGSGMWYSDTNGQAIRTLTPFFAPTLTSIVPNTFTQGQTVTVTVTGSNFVPNIMDFVMPGAVVNSLTVVSSTVMTVNLTVFGPAGLQPVAIVSPGGTSSVLFVTVNLPAYPITTMTTTTPAGSPGQRGTTDGTGSAARFESPGAVWTDGTNLWIADTGNHAIRRMVIATGVVTTVAGLSGTSGSADGTGTAARFLNPTGVWANHLYLYIVDSGNHTIRRMDLLTLAVTTFAGSAGQSGNVDDVGSLARFNSPSGIFGTHAGFLAVTDTGNSSLRLIDDFGDVFTHATSLQSPVGITGDVNNFYVTTIGNHQVQQISLAGTVTLLAGSSVGATDGVGSSARFNTPRGIWTDGTNLFVADTGNNAIRHINILTRQVTTILSQLGAGTGSSDGIGTAARFNQPYGITGDGTRLFIADRGNMTIRRAQ